jgi:hypothetical protein
MRRSLPTLLLPLTARAHGISGVVVDTLGRPLLAAVVRVAPGDSATRSDADGQFVLPWHGPGTYTLTVRRIGFRERTEEVTVRPGRAPDGTMEEVPGVRTSRRLKTLVNDRPDITSRRWWSARDVIAVEYHDHWSKIPLDCRQIADNVSCDLIAYWLTTAPIDP